MEKDLTENLDKWIDVVAASLRKQGSPAPGESFDDLVMSLYDTVVDSPTAVGIVADQLARSLFRMSGREPPPGRPHPKAKAEAGS